MSIKYRATAIAVVLLFVVSGGLLIVNNSRADRSNFWVTVDNAELAHIKSLTAAGDDGLLKSVEVRQVRSGIAILRLNDLQMEELSRSMHDNFHKCSGFIAHRTEDEAVSSIDEMLSVEARQQFVAYSIDNQANVNPMLALANEPLNRQVIIDLAGFPNRRYNQPSGIDSANWIYNKWVALAAGRSDTTVEYYNHPTATSPQPSIVLTIQGRTLPNEIVVVGGHQDSINTGGATLAAPGADDDASGIACLTETIRVIMAANFKPNRTVKFMAYAAEEIGLRGSNAIATDFRNANKNVVGVMQFDMTNYKGVLGYDIVLFQDYTTAAQNQFVTSLITTYQPTMTIGTSSCGYACSDHASWFNKAYPVSFPFEATFNDDNSAIHSVNDTLAVSGNNANHALKFTKLSLSYVGELAKGSIVSRRNVAFDYDGDSRTDASIYRPSNGEWYLYRSLTGFAGYQFGATGDILAPADFTGDGKTDVAVFRPASGTWYVLRSEDSTFYGAGFGTSGDVPSPADYDGDGKADLAVFRPGAQAYWYLQQSTAGFAAVPFGTTGDVPAMGDFDGDGKSDISVYRPSLGQWFRYNSSTGSFYGLQFGSPGDKIVQADYTGDGKTDCAVFRPSTSTWYVLRSETPTFFGGGFGAAGDIPVPGDYDGDGKFDFAVWRPLPNGVYYLQQTTAGFAVMPWGLSTDRPTASAFVY